MAESDRDELRREPQVLANIRPTIGQRRTAGFFVLALLAILAATWPFATVKWPESSAFVPSLAAALFISDCVTAVLLFGQFSILRQRALLIIANGYLFSALIVIAHALAFPGAFSRSGLFGAGLQSAVWLYWFWHAGLPLAIIGYALTKDADRRISDRSTRLVIGSSVAATATLVIGMFWFVTQHHELLPVTFVDVRPLSLFRRIIGGVVILLLGGTALYLLWSRRRTLLDEWLMVALCALLIEVALASVLSGDRYTVSWYAGRFYQLVTATVVMVVLLAEMTTLYANVARSNTLLERERLLLERAMQAQRREREARLMTGDAVAASIAHEVRQPLTAMVTTADAGLRFLDRPVPSFDKAKEAFARIAADGLRAGEVVGSIRANFKSDLRDRSAVEVNELIQEALALTRGELQKHRIVIHATPNTNLPVAWGNRVQLQQVLLNLIMNAVDAMAAKEGPRTLTVTCEAYEGERVLVSVADTGPGVALQDSDRLFNPLFTTKADGMGMGLSICRAIIEAHEGRLWYAPNANGGAVFLFTLQVDKSATAAT
ncbi:MAG TPA: MASE4 domain-containing protein [Dehalococcoidia bacterium]|nr:MASE4 domain-containing protein [Dehalococcoidia bacterium]